MTARGTGACGGDNRLLMYVGVTEGGIGGCRGDSSGHWLVWGWQHVALVNVGVTAGCTGWGGGDTKGYRYLCGGKNMGH